MLDTPQVFSTFLKFAVPFGNTPDTNVPAQGQEKLDDKKRRDCSEYYLCVCMQWRDLHEHGVSAHWRGNTEAIFE